MTKLLKSRVTLLCAIAALAAAPAGATIYTYAFGGTFASGNYAPATGTTVSGTYTFDDAGVDSQPGNPNLGQYPGIILSATINGLGTLTGGSGASISVEDDNTPIVFTVEDSFIFTDGVTSSTTGGSPTLMTLLLRTSNFFGPIGVLSNDSLTGVPHNLAAWDEETFSVSFNVAPPCAFCTPPSFASWTLTSLELVPEPSSLVLSLGGLVGLASLRLRRR